MIIGRLTLINCKTGKDANTKQTKNKKQKQKHKKKKKTNNLHRFLKRRELTSFGLGT
jgi:hypothetical protein